jgi:hypothetical protein
MRAAMGVRHMFVRGLLPRTGTQAVIGYGIERTELLASVPIRSLCAPRPTGSAGWGEAAGANAAVYAGASLAGLPASARAAAACWLSMLWGP